MSVVGCQLSVIGFWKWINSPLNSIAIWNRKFHKGSKEDLGYQTYDFESQKAKVSLPADRHGKLKKCSFKNLVSR
jgi:hypothetical protein